MSSKDHLINVDGPNMLFLYLQNQNVVSFGLHQYCFKKNR